MTCQHDQEGVLFRSGLGWDESLSCLGGWGGFIHKSAWRHARSHRHDLSTSLRRHAYQKWHGWDARLPCIWWFKWFWTCVII